jgi:hypothetical protein
MHHCWDEIAAYIEMKLFLMVFPEDFMEVVILPTMTNHLGSKLMLDEFYKWLGCNFFMACFQGIWSKEAVLMFDGASFCLNSIMP